LLWQFSMNPFYQYDTPIRSNDFETRVKSAARRYNLS
jgi:Sedlin, N-terminal conserved region